MRSGDRCTFMHRKLEKKIHELKVSHQSNCAEKDWDRLEVSTALDLCVACTEVQAGRQAVAAQNWLVMPRPNSWLKTYTNSSFGDKK